MIIICEPGSNINQPSETNTIAPTGVAPSSPESIQLPTSGEGPPTREWVLVGMADSSQLGSTKRLAELRKSEHGNNHSYHFIVKSIVLEVYLFFMLQTPFLVYEMTLQTAIMT